MADSKSGMNLPASNRTSLVISDLKSGISGMRQETSLLKQDWTNLVQTMGTGVARLNGAGGNGPGGQSSSKVAPDPTFSNTGQQAIGNGNQVFAGPNQSGAQAAIGGGGSATPPTQTGTGGGGGGGMFRNLSDFVSQNPGSAALYGAGTALMGANATSDMVQSELLQTRINAYMPQQKAGPALAKAEAINSQIFGPQNTAYVRNAINAFANRGAMNDKMDSFNALAAAQSYGLNGPNFLVGKGGQFEGSFAEGVAQASQLTPGMGGQGAMRAAGAMQRGKTVNMLKGVGINIRDEQGNLKPPNEIIEMLWKKICREYAGAYGSGKTPSEREVLIGFQQGNSMDSMVQNLFGDDPMVYMMIKNGLIFKARTAGAPAADQAMTATNMVKAGMTTDAVRSMNRGAATATEGLTLTNTAGARAYGMTKTGLTEMGELANLTSPGAVIGLNTTAAILQTLGAAGNGAVGNILKFLTALVANGGKAAGGEVGGQSPYIVGEKGPEMFIPKTDGVIIPNHLMDTKNRHQGGGVHGPAHPAGKTYKGVELEKLLKQAGFTGKGLEDAIKIVGAESGGRSSAEGDKGLADSTWDYSIGLFQVRSLKDWKSDPKREPTHLYDPLQNAKEAYKISNGGTNWSAWRNSAAKLGFIDPATKKPYTSDASSSAADTDTALKSLAASTGTDYNKLKEAFAYFEKTGKIKSGTTLSSILGAGVDPNAIGNLATSAASTYNYGGVTFNMNVVGGDPKKIESILKGLLEKLKNGLTIGTN
jgi:Lysozyme like domain